MSSCSEDRAGSTRPSQPQTLRHVDFDLIFVGASEKGQPTGALQAVPRLAEQVCCFHNASLPLLACLDVVHRPIFFYCGRALRAAVRRQWLSTMGYHGTDVLFIFAPRIVVAVQQVKLTSQAADGRRLLSVYI